MADSVPGGTLSLADDLNPVALSRMGYGAMQLAGPASAVRSLGCV